MPPAASLNDLSDARVVVSRADKESEVVAVDVRFDAVVLGVQYFVQLLHELYVDHLLEIGLFDFIHIDAQAIGFRNWNLEMF